MSRELRGVDRTFLSLIDSAKMNDLDPYADLSDVLDRLPTHPASRVAELLPHRWRPSRRVCRALAEELMNSRLAAKDVAGQSPPRPQPDP